MYQEQVPTDTERMMKNGRTSAVEPVYEEMEKIDVATNGDWGGYRQQYGPRIVSGAHMWNRSHMQLMCRLGAVATHASCGDAVGTLETCATTLASVVVARFQRAEHSNLGRALLDTGRPQVAAVSFGTVLDPATDQICRIGEDSAWDRCVCHHDWMRH